MTTATASRVFESFLRHLRAENKSPKTIRAYQYGVESLLAYLASRGMPINPEHIKREHIEAFMEDGLARLAPATVNQWFRSCQQFFKWLADEDYVTVSPMANMRPPAVPETLPPVLTEEQVVTVIKALGGKRFEDRRDNAIIRLMLDTGMRLAECASIQAAALDLNANVVTIMGKGRRERLAPFGNKTSKAIDRYLVARDSHEHHYSPALWLAPKGPLTADGLYQMVQRRGQQLGIADLHPHRFRHSAAHEWLSAGGTEGHLMVLMGWSSPTMVRRYAKSAAAGRAVNEHRRLALMDRL